MGEMLIKKRIEIDRAELIIHKAKKSTDALLCLVLTKASENNMKGPFTVWQESPPEGKIVIEGYAQEPAEKSFAEGRRR